MNDYIGMKFHQERTAQWRHEADQSRLAAEARVGAHKSRVSVAPGRRGLSVLVGAIAALIRLPR